ncbi:MAG: hypothetical protein GDA48_09695 [Hormoscilla sp. GM102CHS1]|nr:hypothetical protein [Hormoscilla sp. GM102CHS1]
MIPSSTPNKEVYLDATDYVALKALYESTGGTKWRNREGWDFSSDTPPLAKVVDNWPPVQQRVERYAPREYQGFVSKQTIGKPPLCGN